MHQLANDYNIQDNYHMMTCNFLIVVFSLLCVLQMAQLLGATNETTTCAKTKHFGANSFCDVDGCVGCAMGACQFLDDAEQAMEKMYPGMFMDKCELERMLSIDVFGDEDNVSAECRPNTTETPTTTAAPTTKKPYWHYPRYPHYQHHGGRSQHNEGRKKRQTDFDECCPTIIGVSTNQLIVDIDTGGTFTMVALPFDNPTKFQYIPVGNCINPGDGCPGGQCSQRERIISALVFDFLEQTKCFLEVATGFCLPVSFRRFRIPAYCRCINI